MTEFSSVDLHCHSTASDGTLRPADVVRLAADRGLCALALTDHDTVAGLAEAEGVARNVGIDFLPGIELSCYFPRPGTLHLLGYGVDPTHPTLLRLVEEQAAARAERNRLMVERLNRIGLDLHWEEVVSEAGRTDGAGTIGRPHLAAVMVRKGHVPSARQAFDRYLGGSGVAYVDNNQLSADRAIATVRAAGGMVSLAHPLQLRRQTTAQLEAMVAELAEQGLEGLEVVHSSHDDAAVVRFTRMADRLGLITTGGSDFHGSNKSSIRIGRPAGRTVPREFYDRIVERLRGRKTNVPRRRSSSFTVAVSPSAPVPR